MEKLYIYSGDCKQCEVGIPTEANDIMGQPLYTGDIVVIEGAYTCADSLTVVICEQFQNFYGKDPVKLSNQSEFYVMGIKSFGVDDFGDWKVSRVKSHKDIIDGEHWTAFGFNYRKQGEE